MKRITLNKGFSLVDDEDYEYLNQFNWQLHEGYARRNCLIAGKITPIYMHREILKLEKGSKFIADHVNRNKLDNRQKNLRICTRRQNVGNAKIWSTNTSGHRGVIKNSNKKRNIWTATICPNNKKVFLGNFDKIEDAALAYNDAAFKLFGKFAKLNTITHE